MVRDNLFIASTRYPPETDQAAVERVSEFGALSLTNLVDMAFIDIRQLRVALSEAGYSCQDKILLGKSRIKTHKILAIGRDGTEYTMFLTEIGPRFLRVDNAEMTKPGENVDPHNLQLVKDLDDRTWDMIQGGV